MLALASNSSWLVAEQVLRAVVGLFVGIWLARHLGPVDFGRLSFALSLVSLFAIVGTLGLNRIIVRELVEYAGDAERTAKLMSTALALRLLSGIALTVACVAAVWLFDQGAFLLVVLVGGTLLFRPADGIDLFFQSRSQNKLAAWARTLAFGLATTARVGLLVLDAGVMAFALLVLVEAALGAVALLWLNARRGGTLSRTFVDRQLARQLLTECWPEIIAGFCGLALLRLDQVMLNHLASAEAVGVFAVASRLSEAWLFIPSAIVASAFPLIIRQRAADPALYVRRLGQLLVGVTALSYAAIALASIFAEPVVHYLFGPAYAASAPVLAIHVWCGLFITLGSISGSWLMSERRIELNLYRNLCGAAVNVVLNAAWIPEYGARGAACATLASLVTAYFLFDFAVPAMRPMARAKLWALVLRVQPAR